MDNKTELELHKRIAKELMKEMESDKDMNVIINRDKVFSILEKLENKSSYIPIHEQLTSNNGKEIETMEKNNNYLFDNLLRKIQNTLQFDVELEKHGKSMHCTVNRYAMIIYPEGIYSMKKPLSSDGKFDRSQAKDKTSELERCTFFPEEIQTTKTDWSVPSKKFRLRLTYPQIEKKDQKDHMYLYFTTEERRKQAEDLLKLIKLRKKDQLLDGPLQNMSKTIEYSNVLYSVMKLINVKNKVVNNKQLLFSFKNDFETKSDAFISFYKKSASLILEKYRIMKGNDNKTSIAKRTRVNAGSMANFIPSRKIAKPRLSIKGTTEPETEDNFIKASEIKMRINTITKTFPEYFRSLKAKDSTQNNQEKQKIKENNRSKAVRFLLKNVEVSGNGNESQNIKMLKNAKTFTINRKKAEIVFDESTTLDYESINDISSIFMNSDIHGRYSDNSICINGPKLEILNYIHYQYKNHKIQENKLNFPTSDKFVEPEKFALSFSQNYGGTYKSFFLQNFQTHVFITQEDLKLINNKSKELLCNENLITPENLVSEVFYYFEIDINGLYKTKTNLVSAKNYDFANNDLVIELNKQYLFAYDSLNIFDNIKIRITLKCIPKILFDISIKAEDKPFLVDYMNSHTIAYGIIDRERIESKNHELILYKPYQKFPDNKSSMIINILDDYEVEGFKTKVDHLEGINLPINSEIYVLDHLDKSRILALIENPNVNDSIKEELKKIKFNKNGNLLLRFPTDRELLKEKISQDDIIKGLKDQNVSDEDIDIMFLNKNVSILPYIQRKEKVLDYNEKFNQAMSYSSNLYLNAKDIAEEKGFIYNLTSVRKYFLAQFKGVTQNRKIVYHNYTFNTIDVAKLDEIIINADKNSYDISDIKNSNKYCIDFYDLDEIEPSSVENFNNNLWKICIRFTNKTQMNVFNKIIKKIKEEADFKTKEKKCIRQNYSVNPTNAINSNLLVDMYSNIKSNIKSLKIILTQIEFRQNFVLSEDCRFELKVSKNSLEQSNTISDSMILEILNCDKNKFRNSLMNNQILRDNLDLIKSSQNVFKILPKTFVISKKEFNDSHKIIKLDFIDKKDKVIELEVKPNQDKVFFFEMTLKSQNKTLTFNSSISLDNIIKNNPKADLLFVPLYAPLEQETKQENQKSHIVAILSINCFSTIAGNNNSDFETEFERCLKKMPTPIDKYNNYITLGKLEPNVYRRKLIKKIQNIFKTDIDTLSKIIVSDSIKRRELCGFLEHKCIIGASDLFLDPNNKVWKSLVVDVASHYNKNYKKFYYKYKRNEFYYNFGHSEWKLFLESVYDKYTNKAVPFNQLDPYSLFPDKETLIKWKGSNSSYYKELRKLCYLGIPYGRREYVWDKLLDINKLTNLTINEIRKSGDLVITTELEDAVTENSIEKKKQELYKVFENKVKTMKYFNINFSLIDNDINKLWRISSLGTDCKKENKLRNNIKLIARAYFIWTDLNISTDPFIADKNKKYVYFFGLLQIIQRLLTINDSNSTTFWIIVGMSQILENYSQENPLISNEQNYNRLYVLVSKLIMEQHLKPIFDKIVSLNFPIEYFISNSISALYSDILQTELFERLLDAIFLESSSKTSKLDKYDYLRFTCAIPITIMQLNSNSLLEVKTIREMETVFQDMVKKTFNIEKFFQSLEDNVIKFYSSNTAVFDIYMNGNKESTWDSKRDKLLNMITSLFSPIESENKMFLMKLANTKLSISQDKINAFENKLDDNLSSVRSLYSTGTVEGNPKQHCLLFALKKLFIFNNLLSSLDKKYYINISFADVKPNSFLEYYNTKRETIEFSDDGSIENAEIREFYFDKLPKYILISLFTLKGDLFTSYNLEILKLDLMRPMKLLLESNDKVNKTKLEIGLFKQTNASISNADNDLYRMLFRTPDILYNNQVFNELYAVQDKILETLDSYKKCIESTDKYIINKYINKYGKENSFTLDEFTRHSVELHQKFKFNTISTIVSHKKNASSFAEISKKGFSLKNLQELVNLKSSEIEVIDHNEKDNERVESIKQRLVNLLLTVFNKEQADIVLSWLRQDTSTFEEIMISCVLVDDSTVTIHEKLKFIFDFAKMQNFLIYNDEVINEEKLKNLIYSLYKRFMINFTKNDIDRMVDFALNRDSLHNFTNVILFKDEAYNKIEDAIKNEAPIGGKNNNSKDKDNNSIIDISRIFSLVLSMLKNEYDIAFLSRDLTNLIFNAIMKKYAKDVNEGSINLYLETFNECIRTYKMIKLEKDGDNYILPKEESPLKVKDLDMSYLGELIKNVLTNIEIYNNELNNISYEKFSDIIFKLPFLGDLLRASCSFNSYPSYDFIKVYENVRVEVNLNDNISHNFMFVKNYDVSFYRSTKNVKYYCMNKQLSSAVCFGDIISKISSNKNLQQTSVCSILDDLSTVDTRNLSFSFNNTMNNIQESIRLYDPLYSNYELRKAALLEDTKLVHLIIKMNSNDDVSILHGDEKLSLRLNGFAMLKHVDDKGFHWMECKVKEKDIRLSLNKNASLLSDLQNVKFKCFENKFKFTIPKGNIIYDDSPIDYN